MTYEQRLRCIETRLAEAIEAELARFGVDSAMLRDARPTLLHAIMHAAHDAALAGADLAHENLRRAMDGGIVARVRRADAGAKEAEMSEHEFRVGQRYIDGDWYGEVTEVGYCAVRIRWRHASGAQDEQIAVVHPNDLRALVRERRYELVGGDA